ncbi:NADPH-dependent 2,4-dienoyl-CoA reductase/sulfur reductase-like enzyme [Mycolicibacterium iranicum]|uniref:NADPH-dependent 2,4-dienoyl-CoA reductase/sulfur reductase-like enzyme n=1 Tax=Mycolicibacterium iranicum TaxID=912594 RepID=A0A839Q1U2_MYCIR|nr:NAD(P)/FAD-dependent oxidoreductase [Mycolicibacterium iranicum]MBB2989789.1 NADPH-dependent 2,4-dienoyl-CoA reductase/sulfur reductase-like enzyme [Mycolicibacterium iranicum]
MAAPGFLAIGSGPAGVSAAETFRRRHPHIPVRILSADPALPYAKPPLSKEFLGGGHTNLDLHSAGWFARHNIDLRLGVTVERIDVDAQEVVTVGGARYPYWHLVLASGSAAVPLAVPGGQSAQPLRSFADAVALKMAARFGDTAVVIGGGLIGCETASCLAGLGLATTLVIPEAAPLLRRFGVDVGKRVAEMLADAGTRVLTSTTVDAIDDNGVTLMTGERVDADVIVAATGVRPDIRLATRAGLATDRGRVVVDERMRTSVRNIYAAGDIAIAHNVAAGRRVVSEHWRDAAQQGLVAGLTAAGAAAAWDKIPGYSGVIGAFTLKYRGWGSDYDSSDLIERADGFSATYRLGDKVVGTLTVTANPAS